MKQHFFGLKTTTFYKVLLTTILLSFGCKKNDTQPKPIADFSADSTTVYQGEKISFSDLSKNSPTSYEWHFFGGTPEYFRFDGGAVDNTPFRDIEVKYEMVGTYSVTLTVKNSGGENSITKNNYITVIEDPRPRIHGKIVGVDYVSDVSVKGTYLNQGVSLGGTMDIIGGNSFELRIPTKYLGKTLSLSCHYGCGDLYLYLTGSIEVTIAQETYVDFPTSSKSKSNINVTAYK